MLWTGDALNQREEEILRAIRQYLEDYRVDTWNEGHEEGYKEAEVSVWDEARNKGYDEGWEDACDYILNNILQERSGLVFTPSSHEEATNFVKDHKAFLPVLAVINFYVDKITKLKINKDA